MLAVTALGLTESCASCKLSTQTQRTLGGVVGQKSLPLTNSCNILRQQPVAYFRFFPHIGALAPWLNWIEQPPDQRRLWLVINVALHVLRKIDRLHKPFYQPFLELAP